jgi:hypothetical protein
VPESALRLVVALPFLGEPCGPSGHKESWAVNPACERNPLIFLAFWLRLAPCGPFRLKLPGQDLNLDKENQNLSNRLNGLFHEGRWRVEAGGVGEWVMAYFFRVYGVRQWSRGRPNEAGTEGSGGQRWDWRL